MLTSSWRAEGHGLADVVRLLYHEAGATKRCRVWQQEEHDQEDRS
jgi:hypothetical protein